ncbi:hypothetical protein CBL_07923 [Carabus blaptoides fortunei]
MTSVKVNQTLFYNSAADTGISAGEPAVMVGAGHRKNQVKHEMKCIVESVTMQRLNFTAAGFVFIDPDPDSEPLAELSFAVLSLRILIENTIGETYVYRPPCRPTVDQAGDSASNLLRLQFLPFIVCPLHCKYMAEETRAAGHCSNETVRFKAGISMAFDSSFFVSEFAAC